MCSLYGCVISHSDTQMTATTQHILIAPAVRRVQKHESHEYSDLWRLCFIPGELWRCNTRRHWLFFHKISSHRKLDFATSESTTSKLMTIHGRGKQRGFNLPRKAPDCFWKKLSFFCLGTEETGLADLPWRPEWRHKRTPDIINIKKVAT